MKKWFWDTHFKRGTELYIHGHEFVIGAQVEQFLSIAPPCWLGAAAGGDLEFCSRRWKGLNINFEFSGFIRAVSNPFSERTAPVAR